MLAHTCTHLLWPLPSPLAQTFTRKLEVERSRLPGWPSKGLVVLGEHSSALYDLMNPAIMELLFGPAAWDRTRRLLRSLHVSSEYASGSQKAIIRLSVNLPADGDADAMTRLLTAVTLLIDIVGTYKLSPGGHGGHISWPAGFWVLHWGYKCGAPKGKAPSHLGPRSPIAAASPIELGAAAAHGCRAGSVCLTLEHNAQSTNAQSALVQRVPC